MYRRVFTIAFAAMLCAGPSLADQPYLNPKIVPCRTFTAALGTSGFSILLDSVTQYPHVYDLGSTANVTDYVLVTCRAHPGFTIGQAIDRLLQQQKRGKLPQIPMGGA